MTINHIPNMQSDNTWNYGFVVLKLARNSDEMAQYGERAKSFMQKAEDAAGPYGHTNTLHFDHRINDDNTITISAKAYTSSLEKKVAEKIEGGGLGFQPVPMTPGEQELFLSENKISQEVINRITNLNGNSEAENITRNSFEKCLKTLNVTIEE